MKALIAFIIFGTIIMAGCARVADHVEASKQSEPQWSCQIAKYSNGVFFFDCVDIEFALALSKFKGDNPSIAVSAISGNGTLLYGVNSGFFVSTEQK